MVVMKEDVNESSEYLKRRQDFPTPKIDKYFLVNDKTDKSYEVKNCVIQRKSNVPLSPIKRSLIK